MAVYEVRTRDVFVLGKGWYGQTMCYTYVLPKDVAATRGAIRNWLDRHAGDFQSITDFAASIEEVEIEWESLDNEDTYTSIMFASLVGEDLLPDN